MTRTIGIGIQDLGHDYPEWKPWLIVVGEVLQEAIDPKWEILVPAEPRAQEKVPRLAEVGIRIEIDFIRKWVKRLLQTASKSGTPKMVELKRADDADLDIPALFQASLCQNGSRLPEMACRLGVDVGAFQAVAELVAIPFLQACGRRWAFATGDQWREGYCPICGAWPAFAEVRGTERSRYLRCARCGGDWQIHWLHCPYCETRDRHHLISLAPENGGMTRTVEACKRCLCYIKSFTVLQKTPLTRVILDDLASVDLDVAAMKRGFRSPEGPGFSLGVRLINNTSPKQKMFRWSR